MRSSHVRFDKAKDFQCLQMTPHPLPKVLSKMQDPPSLEDTPTWAVAAVCFFLIFLSILIDHAIQIVTRFLRQRKRKALAPALQTIKAELMLMGFISLLLTVGEVPISRICFSKRVDESFGPCRNHKPTFLDSSETADHSSCEAKGMVSLISRDGIRQLHIFVFVLAIFHVLSCVLI